MFLLIVHESQVMLMRKKYRISDVRSSLALLYGYKCLDTHFCYNCRFAGIIVTLIFQSSLHIALLCALLTG